MATEFLWAQKLRHKWPDLFSLAELLPGINFDRDSSKAIPVSGELWFANPSECLVSLYNHDRSKHCPGVLDFRGWRPLNGDVAGPQAFKIIVDDRQTPPIVLEVEARPGLTIRDRYLHDKTGIVAPLGLQELIGARSLDMLLIRGIAMPSRQQLVARYEPRLHLDRLNPALYSSIEERLAVLYG